MELSIYNQQGNDSGRKAELSEAVFGLVPNEHAVYLDVKQYLANHRQGTHKTKERSEVSGSTRKLHKQKGTGGARIGDINSPLLSGGARVFGPRPRDYRFKLNKKLKALARRSALSAKAQDAQIIIIDNINFEAPKTKDFIEFQKNLKIEGKKLLLVLSDHNKNVYLSARNVPNVKVMSACDLNTYSLLNNNVIVMTEGCLDYVNNL